jgi:long-chain acyl-CoA synthetase
MKINEAWYQYPSNLVDLFEDSYKKFKDRPWIGKKNQSGDYDFKTYGELGTRIDNLRGGMAQLGIQKDESVGLIINNSIEWAVIAFATYGLGARLVPMYENELEKTWKYIVEDSGITLLYVANQKVSDQVKGYVDEIETLEKIILIDGKGDGSMAGVEQSGESNPIDSIKPHYSDIAVLIYTSGTTGAPKGVLLSHGNFTTNVQAASKLHNHLNETDVTLSILPWAHSFGQTAELYNSAYNGFSTGMMGSVDTLVDDMAKIRPTMLIAVPRIFNKVYARIHNMMDEKGGLAKKLFELAKGAAAEKRKTGNSGIKYAILDKIVLSKIRDRFGGRLKLAITGSAAMNLEIATFFSDIGIPTYDCYGLTETTPAMTMNSPRGNMLGSVGRAIDKVTVKIDKSLVGEDSPDGEIVCFGPNVMQGYHNKPEQTAAVMVEDPELGTGFRTGDRGRLDENGYLFITGRFKEEYKLENGKYVHPASLEEDIKLNSYIANAMIYGEGKVYNVSIIVPDFIALTSYVESLGLNADDPNEIVSDERVQTFLGSEVTQQLKTNYGGYEIPKKFIFVPEDFSLENGLLTQTMKLKRKVVLNHYQDELNSLYT